MKTFSRISMAILVLSLTSSCEKNPLKFKEFGGRVMDFHTGQGIPGATVFVYDHSLPSGKDYVADTITDQNGNFQFALYAGNGRRNLALIAGKKLYYKTPPGEVKVNQTEDVYKENELYLISPGFIRFRLKNVSPYDSTDLIDFEGQHRGMYVDTVLPIMSVRSGTPESYYCISKKHGVVKYLTPVITIQPLDTIDYTISY